MPTPAASHSTDQLPPTAADALAAVSAIASDFAGSADLDAVLPDALGRLAAVLGAAACTVWVADADGRVAARWSWGDAPAGDAERAAGVIAGQRLGDPDVVPLRAAGVVVGALARRALAPDAGALPLAAAADLIGPAVATAARAARAAADASEHRRFVERVVDSLPLGLHVIDRDYRIQLWNRKRETGTQGVSREEAIGRSIFDVLHRQDASLMRREFDEVLATGRLQQFQMESRSTGELRTYRLTKIPMRVDDGAPAGEVPVGDPTHVITLGEDITEWKAAMDRTAQSEKLAAIGQLAAGVMHEVNNPLATIAACAETMTLALDELPRGQKAPPGFAEYLRIVDHEVHRCRRIIDGLLNFSRAKGVQRVRVGLNAIVEQTLFLLKHHASFKRTAVRLELADGLGPEVTCDPDQLTQVVMALLLNAADAVASHATLEDEELPYVLIRTGDAGGDALLEVVDTGVGIARDDLPKIFEPFFTTKPQGAGTGLGLAICYGIVRDHGGRIEVDSEVGVGSTFRVALPSAGVAGAVDDAAYADS